MSNCLNCDKPLIHKEGRRKKKFCDEKCRGEYWRKQNKKPKYVQIETFEALQKELAEFKNNKLVNKSETKKEVQEDKAEIKIKVPEFKSDNTVAEKMRKRFEEIKNELTNKNK